MANPAFAMFKPVGNPEVMKLLENPLSELKTLLDFESFVTEFRNSKN